MTAALCSMITLLLLINLFAAILWRHATSCVRGCPMPRLFFSKLICASNLADINEITPTLQLFNNGNRGGAS